MKGRRRKGRPTVFAEELKLTNFRLPVSLLEELDDARFALGKSTLAELVREALRKYLDENAVAVQEYRKFRKKHGN